MGSYCFSCDYSCACSLLPAYPSRVASVDEPFSLLPGPLPSSDLAQAHRVTYAGSSLLQSIRKLLGEQSEPQKLKTQISSKEVPVPLPPSYHYHSDQPCGSLRCSQRRQHLPCRLIRLPRPTPVTGALMVLPDSLRPSNTLHYKVSFAWLHL